MRASEAFLSRFKNVIARVGSDQQGERHTAADRAFALCDQNDISFLEALDGAFGSGSNDAELRRQISNLEEDNRKLAEALNVLNEQHQIIPDDAGKELLRKLWSYPQTRLLWTLLTASGVSWAMPMLTEMTDHLHRGWGRCWSWIFILGTAHSVWEWAVAEYARRGVGITLLKAVAVVLCVSIAMFACRKDVYGCCIVLLWAAILSLTNLANWLADQLAHSETEVFATLRSWFA